MEKEAYEETEAQKEKDEGKIEVDAVPAFDSSSAEC